jgi:hypothetical protein
MDSFTQIYDDVITRNLAVKIVKTLDMVRLYQKEPLLNSVTQHNGQIHQVVKNEKNVLDNNESDNIDNDCNLLLFRLVADYNQLNDKRFNAIYFTIRHVHKPTPQGTRLTTIILDYTFYRENTTSKVIYKEWKRPELVPVHHNQVDADYLNNLRIDTYLSMAAEELLKDHGNKSISFMLRPIDEDILPHLKAIWESKKFECIVARDTPRPDYFLITLKWSMTTIKQPEDSTTSTSSTIEKKDEQV